MQCPPCFVRSSLDALIVLNGAIAGTLNSAKRRFTQQELDQYVFSGSVIVYGESSSDIKRWTDKRTWSSSRAINNFFGYLEMTEPGDKSLDKSPKPKSSESKDALERDLVGALESMVGSARYKKGGLIKRTFAVPELGLHLVNYVDPVQVREGLLDRPSNMACFDPLRVAKDFNTVLLEASYRNSLEIRTDQNGMLVNIDDCDRGLAVKYIEAPPFCVAPKSSSSPSPPPAYHADMEPIYSAPIYSREGFEVVIPSDALPVFPYNVGTLPYPHSLRVPQEAYYAESHVNTYAPYYHDISYEPQVIEPQAMAPAFPHAYSTSSYNDEEFEDYDIVHYPTQFN